MRPTTNTTSASTTVLHGDGSRPGPANGSNGSSTNGFSLGMGGGPGKPSSSPSPLPGSKPFAHIDDIKNVQLDVSSVTPVETLLTVADECLKQARFMKDFGRYDIALKEYLKGSIVLLEVLPSSPAWISTMTDQKGARARYNGLMSLANTESADYDRIKTLIQEDNARTGVQPKTTPAPTQTPAGKTVQGRYGRTPGGAHERSQSLATNNHAHVHSNWPEVPTSLLDSDVRKRVNGSSSNSSSSKPKPAIQPKPQALAGNAIKPGAGNNNNNNNNSSSRSAQDLAERFANLRARDHAPVEPKQDPRIRTQPISHHGPPPQPSQPSQLTQQPALQQQHQSPPLTQFQAFRAVSPTASSASRTPYPPLATHALPDLPKVPDAIYSPARGSISSQSPQPPTSAPKAMFSRTNSTASFTGMIVKTPTAAPRMSSSEEYFSMRSSLDRQPGDTAAAAKRPRVWVPEGDTITAQELLMCMQAGSKDVQMLLIDVRSREEFDEGHILSQATICVEQDTLQRENISAGDIADSMVLAPAAEKRLFDRRRECDLVVYYDQDSSKMRLYGGDDMLASERAVIALYNALAYYDFHLSDEANKKPKLLKGGIEAWVAMMGPSSLQTSSTAAATAAGRAGAGAGAGAGTAAGTAAAGTASGGASALLGHRSSVGAAARPLSKYMVKPIQDAAEAQRWEESFKNMDKSAYVRTTDDFLRRFPPVSAIQESMVSPTASPDSSSGGGGGDRWTSLPHNESSTTVSSSYGAGQPSARTTDSDLPQIPQMPQHRPPLPPSASAVADMYSSLPAPPARPAPTVPRTSHSTALEAEEDEDDHYIRTRLAKAGAAASGRRAMRRQKVGLYNPGNWCYGNSSFQSLFASGAFSEELTTGEWLNRWKVPMKSDEKISHPQLLAKMLANWFHWMQFGKFEAMKAQKLMEYCYHIHSRDFDGSIKTDRSTIFGGPHQQDAQEFISFLLTILHDETNRLRDRTGEVQQPTIGPRSTALSNGLQYWDAYRQYNDSLVDRYWRGVEVTDRRCRACGHPSLTYEPFDALHLPIPPADSSATTLAELLAQYCSADTLAEYKCDECRRTGTTDQRARLVRLPELLCVSFRRFQGNEYYGFEKNNTAVVFPIDGLDMTPYTVQGHMAAADVQEDLQAMDKTGGSGSGSGSGSNKTGEDAAAEEAAAAAFRGPFLYDCYAVIVHSGTLRSGHYRSFVRDEGAGLGAGGGDMCQWHHFDDARIEPVTIGSGDGRDMARRLYRDNNQASAYMVFYKRRM